MEKYTHNGVEVLAQAVRFDEFAKSLKDHGIIPVELPVDIYNYVVLRDDARSDQCHEACLLRQQVLGDDGHSPCGLTCVVKVALFSHQPCAYKLHHLVVVWKPHNPQVSPQQCVSQRDARAHFAFAAGLQNDVLNLGL